MLFVFLLLFCCVVFLFVCSLIDNFLHFFSVFVLSVFLLSVFSVFWGCLSDCLPLHSCAVFHNSETHFLREL